MSCVIRPAVLADAPDIARVKVLSWQEGYRGVLDPDYLSNMDIEAFSKATRRWMADPENKGEDWVCVVEEQVVGWAHVRFPGRGEAPESGQAELVALYVLPSVWGQGFGYALNAQVSAALKARGASSMSLWVLEKNVRAIGFYRRQGFSLTDARKPLRLLAGTDLWEVQYIAPL